jgi:hypothetical protein
MFALNLMLQTHGVTQSPRTFALISQAVSVTIVCVSSNPKQHLTLCRSVISSPPPTPPEGAFFQEAEGYLR